VNSFQRGVIEASDFLAICVSQSDHAFTNS
jgi:hypothetical protein